MIEISSLTKRFGSTIAVDDLSFVAPAGQVTGFLGPNGAGKSTTIRCLVGLDRPDAGCARIGGRAFHELREPLREVGALVDSGYVHPGRTGRDHLRVVGATNGISTSRVDEVLEVVGLTSVGRRRVGGYSLGMRQRLGVAAALLGKPQTLILDEPAYGLDPEGIRWMRDLLVQLAAAGATVLVSSHILAEIAIMADHLVVVGRGKLIDTGSVEEFTSRYSRRWVRIRTPQLDQFADALTAAGADVNREDATTATVENVETAVIADLASRVGVTLHELAPQHGTLEDAFISATKTAQEFRSAPIRSNRN